MTRNERAALLLEAGRIHEEIARMQAVLISATARVRDLRTETEEKIARLDLRATEIMQALNAP